MNDQKEKAKKEAEKQLLKFQKEFGKLMSKYPDVMVASNINGDLMAYLTNSAIVGAKICIG